LYQRAYIDNMLSKLGLTKQVADDVELTQDLLKLMHENQTDFTLTFRYLSDLVDPQGVRSESIRSLFELPEAFTPWLERWQQRLRLEPLDASIRQQAMYAVNPVYIPRNHLVEEAISAAEKHQDFGPFNSLVDILAKPFEFSQANARYATPPRPGQVVRQTFCGT
ncbi:MAG: protein adenylyltransferase SelO family protein, partial [Lysobacterales bacterium]